MSRAEGHAASTCTGWRDFVAEFWEKKPRSFQDPNSGLCDEEAIFAGLQCAAEELRAGTIRDHRDLSFHVDDAVIVDPARFLPGPADVLENYLSRLDASLSGRNFTLLVNNFQEFSPCLCKRMRLFARTLFEHLGYLPAGTVSSHVILARYSVSPFAVHKDPNSVFTFVVRGRKTLRVWPFETFADQTGQAFAWHRQLNLYGFDYQPFRQSGIPLSGEAGDVLYWPSTYWHVGETDATSPHLTLHLTFDLHAEPRGEALDLLHSVVESSLSESDWHDSYPIEDFSGSGPLQAPERLIDALRTLTQEMRGTLEDSVKALWLQRMSAQGFWTLARPVKLAVIPPIGERDTVLQVDTTFPVYWMTFGGFIMLAAHGQVIRFPARVWTEALLRALMSSRPFRLCEIAAFSGKGREEIAALATKLVAIGALHIMNGTCSTQTN